MDLEDLLSVIKTDESGFTNKIEDIKDHYFVKIKMKKYMYGNQNTFYALFSNVDDDDSADDLVYANMHMSQYYFNAHVLGSKDENGIFKPLVESDFEGDEYSADRSSQLYVRDFAIKTECIAHIEIVTYG